MHSFARRSMVALAFIAVVVAGRKSVAAQELPHSGSFGLSFVYATSPSGESGLFRLQPADSVSPQPYGATVPSIPSRWAHRRRTLGGLETAIAWAPPLVFMTPMGDGVGNGAVHLVDGRGSPLAPASVLVPTGGNPAAYDLQVVPSLKLVFSAEDTGLGTTRVRGWSFQTKGMLVPTNPAFVDVSGTPAAYVNRMGFDDETMTLHVPTAAGIHVLHIAAAAPQIQATAFVSSGASVVASNPVKFVRGTVTTWIVGTAVFPFSVGLEPLESGFLSWTAAGVSESGSFGAVPSTPSKKWVPSAGAEELAVVSDGTFTYAYCLLREPKPGTFFVKGSAIGVVKFIGFAPAVVSTIPLADEVGEPFSIPAVHGTRVAFETSFGPPFVGQPSDGGERLCVIYSPLDPLGAASADGVLAVPAPLGGRISTQGMDRPLWSVDGKRLFATTSWFPGAPQVGLPGIEVLEVPADVPLNGFVGPHTVVPTPDSPDQSIIFGSVFEPLDPFAASQFGGTSVVGNVSHDGLAAVLTAPFGEIGQKQLAAPKFDIAAGLPTFRSVLPATFDDATGSKVLVPPSFGARRASFDFIPTYSIYGLVMYAAYQDRILLQPTGYETLAELGLAADIGHFELSLPADWITTSEFFAL